MTLPPKYEDAVTCFCGHDLFCHDDYGPCHANISMGHNKSRRCDCRAWAGCLVIAGLSTSEVAESHGDKVEEDVMEPIDTGLP